jgi:hypothetical protein
VRVARDVELLRFRPIGRTMQRGLVYNRKSSYADPAETELATATDKLVPNENKAAREATMRAIKQLVLTCVVLGGFNTLLQAQTAAP